MPVSRLVVMACLALACMLYAFTGASSPTVVADGLHHPRQHPDHPHHPHATATATGTATGTASAPVTSPPPASPTATASPTVPPQTTALAPSATPSVPTSAATRTVTPTPTPTLTPTLAPTGAGGGLAAIKTVFLIVMENHTWSSIQGSSSAPYINSLISGASSAQTSYATQYFTPPGNHPSLPNYLWLEAGANFGIADDNAPSSHPLSTSSHLTALLAAAGIPWTGYMESISGQGCPTSDAYPYAVKHDPFVYFSDTSGNASYCQAHLRPYGALASDLATNTVARYNVITPNLCDDMHDSCAPTNDAIKQGDAWLSSAVPAILSSHAYKNGGAVFIAWDEGEGGSDGPLPFLVLSPSARGQGYHNAIPYTHSSTLRTLEEIFGVSPLLGAAQNATDLGDLFGSTSTVSGLSAPSTPSTPSTSTATPALSTPVATPRPATTTATATAPTIAASPTAPISSTPVLAPTTVPLPASAALLRGVNMSLFDASDQLATNAGTQALLRAHGTPLIRMPFRDSLSDGVELAALQAIKSSGAAPLVIVHGACTGGDPFVPDAHWLGLVQQVFPTGPVYVEYGNEEDLACAGGSTGAQTYTASWNSVVSRLKAQFPTYKFIGPVNFQANPSYIATFVAGATPTPDLISYHEYVCNTSESDSYCMAHIANWATHLANTNSAVQAAIGHTLPVMITEWNLDPFGDARYQNAGFIGPWTTAALAELGTLQSQGLVAAFLYSAESHSIFQLIDSSNALTPQGTAFFG